MFSIGNIAAITVIVYVIGMAAKNIKWISDEWIPVVCGVAGGILGILGLVIGMPDFPATDAINAAAVGIASGLAATGVNQITKQLGKLEIGN